MPMVDPASGERFVEAAKLLGLSGISSSTPLLQGVSELFLEIAHRIVELEKDLEGKP